MLRAAISHRMSEKNYAVAGAFGSTTLGSHLGASLEDHGPTSCFTGQADTPKAYGVMITHTKAAPAQSRSANLNYS